MMRGLELVTIGALVAVLWLGLGFGPRAIDGARNDASATNLPSASGLAWND
jgi:hypothetical protein